jgi:hypothetical protein
VYTQVICSSYNWARSSLTLLKKEGTGLEAPLFKGFRGIYQSLGISAKICVGYPRKAEQVGRDSGALRASLSRLKLVPSVYTPESREGGKDFS